jgi:3-deoxy-D-manno-octulosonate 8-phosphate phosphatase KdsC-like HAD superfamily phosphatase
VLADHYDVDYENIVYIGDDVMDLDIMQGLVDRGGQVYCPLNSAPYITRKFDIISCLGGHGVVMNLYDLFYEDNCDLREFCY